MNLTDRLLAGDPDRPALSDESGATLSHRKLAERVARTRGGLAATGIGPGSRVGLRLGNTCDFAVAYLAVVGVGAAAVPLNPESPAPERAEHLTRSQVSLVLDGALPEGDPTPVVPMEADAPAVLCDTAGTSGRPHSAVLTHGNLLAALGQMAADERTRILATDVALGVLPLFHIYGLQVVLGATLAAGGEVRLREVFDPASPLAGITLLSGVPPMFDAWARAGANAGDARMIVSGAAPLHEATAHRFEEATGRAISQGYGLTEASPVVTSGLLLPRPEPLSVGLPLPGVEVRLVDTDGHDVLEGDPGEIWVRGANIFAGYDGEPEINARVLAGGWLHTGDIGVAGDIGQLYVVDRSKDLIIVSGFNVFPGEVEDVLLEHPQVAQVAVVGVADEHTGEAVRAVVVPAAGASLTAADLVEWSRGRMARYKCPHQVEFVTSLPMLRTGKVLRRQL